MGKTVVTVIIAIFIIILLIYFVQRALFREHSLTKGVLDATQEFTVDSNKISVGDDPSMDYTWSVWIYISNWGYRMGEEKIIIQRAMQTMQSGPCPKLALGENENNLHIYQTLATNTNAEPEVFRCKLDNIPLQKWTNITISLDGRDMDAYLNGKLVRTCVLPVPPLVNSDADVHITPGGGFQGSLSNLKYWAKPINPQQAWNIYKYGPGGNTSLLNQFQVKITLMENGQEENSWTI